MVPPCYHQVAHLAQHNRHNPSILRTYRSWHHGGVDQLPLLWRHRVHWHLCEQKSAAELLEQDGIIKDPVALDKSHVKKTCRETMLVFYHNILSHEHISSWHCSIEYWAILKIQRHKKKEQVQTLDIRSHHNQRIWKPPACQGRAVPPAGLNCPGSARCHRSTALTVDALDNHALPKRALPRSSTSKLRTEAVFAEGLGGSRDFHQGRWP